MAVGKVTPKAEFSGSMRLAADPSIPPQATTIQRPTSILSIPARASSPQPTQAASCGHDLGARQCHGVHRTWMSRAAGRARLGAAALGIEYSPSRFCLT